MKRLIVASAIVVTLALLTAACGTSAPSVPPPVTKSAAPHIAAWQGEDQRRLAEAWQGLALLVEITETQGADQQLAQSYYTALDDMEKAQRSLRELEKTRSMAAAIMEHDGADFTEISAVLSAIAEARRQVLARVGLVP